MAAQFKILVSLLIDKRLKGKSEIYKTEERERLGLRLALPKPKTVVVKPFANVTLGRLLAQGQRVNLRYLSYDQ